MIRDLQQPFDMLRANSRSKRGTSLFEPGLRKLNDVHLAFNHNCTILFANKALSLVQTKDFTSFFKNRSLSGIDVFRLFARHGTGTESNNLAAHIADREHQPVTEKIVRFVAVLSFSLQTSFD